MTVSGTIDKIRYANNGFAVVIITDDDGKSHCLSGRIYDPEVGRRIMAEGEFVVHPKFGPQFSVIHSTVTIPKNRASVIQYLSSGLIKGVGIIMANRIVDKFGVNVIEEIIEKDPEKLTEIPGISSRKAKEIAKCHSQNFAFQELAAMNLSVSQIRKLFDQYETKAVDIVKNNPYKIIYDVDGFSFKTVDRIALSNGTPHDDPKRVSAAITFCLLEIGNQGHCWSHVESLAGMIEELLPDVTSDKIVKQISADFESGKIVADGDKVYAKSIYMAERNTAKCIAKMLKVDKQMALSDERPISPTRIKYAIEKMEDEMGIELEAQQKQAVFDAFSHRFSVITGGPGTGKSTITRAIVSAWMSQYPTGTDPKDHIVLCAPTGRASRRMAEVTGVHAETIQRILKREEIRSSESMEPKLVILDEASMLDIKIASQLMKYVVERDYLVLVGDVDQLPPIGPGSFFRDCVQSPLVPTSRLSLSYRQHGAIAVNAKRINDGMGFHALNLNDKTFRFVEADKYQVQQATIAEYINLINRGYQLKDICCIVPIRKSGKSQTAADDLNVILRSILNPPPDERPKDFNEDKLRVGDRVMSTENDYDLNVFNGDCGTVIAVDYETDTVTVKMDNDDVVDFNRLKASVLNFAYAMTVHKSQGSEFKAAVIVQSMEHYYMLQRNLLYTAATRAKNEEVIVGERRAIDVAVSKIPSLERNSSLKEAIVSFVMH